MRQLALFVVLVLLVVLGAPALSPLLGAAWHRASLPEVGRLVSIGPQRVLNVYTGGTGPRTAVLVHGVPGSGHMMGRLAGALQTQGLRTLTYDRLGWVHSSARPDDELADPTHNARDLLALIAREGIEHPVLVGYSYGGGVVQEANRLEPELPACNVLISSIGNPVGATETGVLTRVLFSEPVMTWALALTPLSQRLSNPTMQALFHPQGVPGAEHLTMLATLEWSVNAWVRERTERFTVFSGFAPERVTRPTLVVHGREDAIVAADIAQALRRDLSHADLAMIDHAGHAIVLTHAERIAKLIAAFIQRCD